MEYWTGSVSRRGYPATVESGSNHRGRYECNATTKTAMYIDMKIKRCNDNATYSVIYYASYTSLSSGELLTAPPTTSIPVRYNILVRSAGRKRPNRTRPVCPPLRDAFSITSNIRQKHYIGYDGGASTFLRKTILFCISNVTITKHSTRKPNKTPSQ